MAEVPHSERAHALLSASGAYRWLNCTPSARLEEKYAQSSGSSSYAEEGTLAHEFGDLNLRAFQGAINQKNLEKEFKKLKLNALYSSEMDFEVQKYVDYVIEAYLEAKKLTSDAVLMVEEKLDFSHLVEQGFGTGDACIVANGVLEIIDLKYGKGVRVDAEKNPQLMLYGSGALRAFELMYDIHTIKLTIVQPRLDHISSYEIAVDELIFWGENTVKPTAEIAYLGEGVQKAGEHCKFCKVKGMCATLAAKNIALAKHEFKDPHLLSDEQIIEVFKQIPMLTDWANAVEEHILKEALNGKKWSGYKVVEGRSQRKWTDEEAVVDKLSKDFKAEDYQTIKLAGIPAIEKLVGKKEFPEQFGAYVVTPQGKPTLVPESDKRPALGLDSAKIDFEN